MELSVAVARVGGDLDGVAQVLGHSRVDAVAALARQQVVESVLVLLVDHPGQEVARRQANAILPGRDRVLRLEGGPRRVHSQHIARLGVVLPPVIAAQAPQIRVARERAL